MESRGTLDIAQLLREAATLSAQAADLAEAGQVADAMRLEDRADRLRRRARSRARTRGSVAAEAAESAGEANIGARGPAQSAREVTIAALNELGAPSTPRALADYAAARFGAEIDHRALAALRRDEMRSWASPRTRRPVYVVPALEGHRFLPIRGKIALSSWPLESRVIGPWSERVDHLKATSNLARQARWLAEVHPEQAGPLLTLLDRYGQTVAAGGTDPAAVESAADAELSMIGEPDVEWRAEAAERARAILDEGAQLWGAKPPRAIAGGVG